MSKWRDNNQPTTAGTRLQQVKGILLLVAFIMVFWWLFFAEKSASVGLETDTAINITPEQIQSIRDIGQWEFLSIADEELVDTVRRGFFSDDHLARIYYGTLRLGVDLQRVQPGDIVVRGDTLVATMPPVGLLDADFIDEARTRPFYESGRWTAADREAMYQRARRMMLSHCLTPQNLRTAEANAETQLRGVFAAMGFGEVIIKFRE